MDDHPELHYMIPAGIFFTAMIGAGVWQVLRVLSRGGIDAGGVVQLAGSLFMLGITCWVGYTALMLWT